MRERLEQYFEFERLGTQWRTELLAGATTFVTMAYIVLVNPSILSETGMPVAAVMAATCVSAGFASILMGIFARYPIALAPGMGLNAYFTYGVVKGMGVSWQTALGAVFLSGVAFFLLTLGGVREKLFTSLPKELFAAVAAGIGLFIAFIGFRNAGIVVTDPATALTLGNLRDPKTALAVCGLLLMAGLEARRVRAAILTGIAVTSVLGFLLGIAEWKPPSLQWDQMTATAFQLDVPGALRLGMLEILFVFLFVDLFDNLGTLVAVTKKAGLVAPDGSIPRINRILLTDATATIAGSMAGTSTVVSYIESSAGIVAGGRSGVTAIVTGVLFLLTLVAIPLAGAVPAWATAPALILVGASMLGQAAEVRWDEPELAIPAFLTITTIPLTFSIANGLAIGLTAYVVLKVLTAKFKEVSWWVYGLALLFVLRFAWLGKG